MADAYRPKNPAVPDTMLPPLDGQYWMTDGNVYQLHPAQSAMANIVRLAHQAKLEAPQGTRYTVIFPVPPERYFESPCFVKDGPEATHVYTVHYPNDDRISYYSQRVAEEVKGAWLRPQIPGGWRSSRRTQISVSIGRPMMNFYENGKTVQFPNRMIADLFSIVLDTHFHMFRRVACLPNVNGATGIFDETGKRLDPDT
jgi:hypothetical protein